MILEYFPEKKELLKAALYPFSRNPIIYVIGIVCAVQAVNAIGGLLGLIEVKNLTSAITIGICVPALIFLLSLWAFQNAKSSQKKIRIEIEEDYCKVITNPGEKDEAVWQKMLEVKETKEVYMIYVMAYYTVPIGKKEIRDKKVFYEALKNCSKAYKLKFKKDR